MRLGRDGLCVSHVIILTVGHAGNLLDQVLAGRIVPAVNGVGVVGHGAILPHSIRGRVGAIFPLCLPAAPARKTAPPSSPAG